MTSAIAKGPGNAESDVAGPDPGAAREAVGRAQVPRNVEPGTAAKNTVNTTAAGPGRAVGWRAGIIPIRAILDPFPDVALHVVKAKGIGGITAD